MKALHVSNIEFPLVSSSNKSEDNSNFPIYRSLSWLKQCIIKTNFIEITLKLVLTIKFKAAMSQQFLTHKNTENIKKQKSGVFPPLCSKKHTRIS